MKKLIILAAIVCSTVVANAATYSWTGDSYWVSEDGSSPLAASVYLFDVNAVDLSAITGALDNNDTTVLSSAIGTGSVHPEEGWFSLSGTGLTDNGGSPATASMAALLIANDGSSDFYYNVGTLNVKISDAVVSGGAPFVWGGNDGVVTGAVGGSGWSPIGASPTPEPTSGLLLLLGFAGLALRRRRA